MKTFPRFWFEANLYFGWIESMEDLEKVFKEYEGYSTKDQVLDHSHNANEELTNFGMYSEHRGPVTLRKFLTDNGIEL